MFTGLSAFPLTPLDEHHVDDAGFAALVERLATAGVDSITALGSTGSYAYLTRDERARLARLAVEHAGDVPVVVGIGSLRTAHVLEHLADAQAAGASAVLLAPMTYQPLTPDEVYGLYEDVTAHLDVPLVVYDNPGTTHVEFTDELHGAIARLPKVAAIKVPPLPVEAASATARVEQLRAAVPATTRIGVSGDWTAAAALEAGCDAWYSVLGGTLPEPALAITRAAAAGDTAAMHAASAALEPIWELFRRYGSLRVTAAIAERLGLVTGPALPRPVRGLGLEARGEVDEALESIGAVPARA